MLLHHIAWGLPLFGRTGYWIVVLNAQKRNATSIIQHNKSNQNTCP